MYKYNLMRTPTISIIVPIYNTEKLLKRCIDSILVQTFTDFELLLIDDGSKDSSSKICDEYAAKDSRIRVFHKENGGVSSARNLGLDNVRGEWITFIDSDDWIDSNCFKYCSKQIENEDDLFMFSFKWAQNHQLPDIVCDKKEEFQAIIYEHINRITFTTPGGKLFRTTIIKRENIRFDTNISSGEDTLFFLTYFSCVKRMRLSSQEFYHYDISSSQNSLSKINSANWKKEHYLIEKVFTEINKIERVHDVKLMEFKLLFSEWRINKYLYALKEQSLKNIQYYIHKVSYDKILCQLVNDKNFLYEIDKYSLFASRTRFKQKILRIILYRIMIKYHLIYLSSIFIKYKELILLRR